MDINYSYFRSHINDHNDDHNEHILLNTEPKDLDKLFYNRTSQSVEQDICYPTDNKDHQSSIISTKIQAINKERILPSKEINLDALSLFTQQQYQHFEKPLFSLYGDNKTQPILQNYGDYRFVYYHPDTGCLRGSSLMTLELPANSTLKDLLTKENYWIDITSPSEDEMKVISKIFHIHPLTTEDIMSHEIREKCDVFRHYLFISYRAFLHDRSHLLKPVTFYNIVTKKHILTFHFGQVPHIYHVQERVKQLQDYIEIVPDWINYAVIDEITDSFAPLIQQIESEVDAIDDLVLLYKTDQSDMILRIGSCRKRVIQMVRLLGTKIDVVRGLMKRIREEERKQWIDEDDREEHQRIYPDVGLYLGDVQDHILTMLQNLSHYETVLTRSESNYLARISIELTQTSNSTNHVIGRLTIFATVLLPMNLITGLWGMNVKVPGKDYDNLLYFFWIVFSLILFAILSLTLAKRLNLI
ncbi:uncharacterized protein BX663DRAFT_460972 [Cokeromyces recurvatus]|uniref:uncharacterized protein n=1 Tax=Cokeromyces recurvatus TaxID=90255 RepID=UPI00221FC54F|nr:uncharacterized protein BX663DRAFT_460972 [Cokeromyces recurvatus]KAI7899060.1 hypothetical protein BX663DRAFT_460972 [Cokeromyces recurvatus]